MNEYRFKVIMLKTDKRTGYVKGKSWEPKGFYYQKRNVIVVGNMATDDTIRVSFPIKSVKIDIIKE